MGTVTSIKVRGGKEKNVNKAVKQLQDELQNNPSLENLGSFRKQFRRLKKMVGSDNSDYHSDKAAIALFRAYLAMIIEMIPDIQAGVQKDRRGLYAMIQLIQLSMELSRALQGLGDKSEQSNNMMAEVIDPNMAMLTQHLSNQFVQAKREVHLAVKGPKARKKIMKIMNSILLANIEYMGAQRESIQVQMTKILEA